MLVITERRGKVGILTLNRPEVRNAMSPELTRSVTEGLLEFLADDRIWAVVLTGASDRAFCAGADLKAMPLAGGSAAPRSGDPASIDSSGAVGGFGGITRGEYPKPLLAAVNGFAFGGGFELALACDFVVAEDHASFALPEVKRGLIAAAGGIVRIAQRIPLPWALELVLTGEPITAQRALELGLVNRVVPKGESVAVAVALAEKICEASPLAVRISKRIVRASVATQEAALFELQVELLRDLAASEDRAEGIRAFAEKRAPQWTGR